MAYNKTTAVTFDVLNEISEYLFQHQNQKNYQYVKTRVADFLVENGEKRFLEVYNETKKTNDYMKALDTFKI